MYVNARGNYYGGLANDAATDIWDMPDHDSAFDRVVKAANKAMIAVLAGDKERSRDLQAQTRQFTTLTEDPS